MNLHRLIRWGKKAPSDSDSYELRKGMYLRREAMADRFGAGLGGLVLLVSAQLAGSPPPGRVTAITLTLAVSTGTALGLARTEFEYSSTALERALQAEDPPDKADRLRKNDKEWPAGPELLYRCSVVLLVLTAVAFLVGVWIAA